MISSSAIFLCFFGLGAAFPRGSSDVDALAAVHTHKFRPETRIINGDDAVPHAYPYQVSIRSRHILFPEICGGSLIKPDTVLTAAHCVTGAIWLEITLGAHNLSDAKEPTQLHLVSLKWTVHKDWSRVSLQNDIAVVKLPYAVTLNDYIQTISLATDRENNYAGHTAHVTGWGRTSDNSGESQTLKVLEVPVISNENCKAIVPFDTVIVDSHMCTDGTGNKGFCAGDSGGPLVNEDGLQIGVVSFTYPSCEKSKPSVYTRVTSFTNWLKQYANV